MTPNKSEQVSTNTHTQRERSGPPYLQTLGNGLTALVALAEGGPMTLRQLAIKLQMNRPVTYRLLFTLVAHGFVKRDEATDTYRIGLRVWELGLTAQDYAGFKSLVTDQVAHLAQTYGESVHLSILDGGDVVYLDKAEGSHPITSYSKLGGRAPAHCVATGKALLAAVSDGEFDRLQDEGFKAFTPLTITEPTAIRSEIKHIREVGYATNRGEWRTGVSGVAVTIQVPVTDELFAIGFSGPTERVLEQEDRLAKVLMDAREEVKSELRSHG